MDFSRIELEELIAEWSGIDIDKNDNYETLLDEWLLENYGIDTDKLSELLNKLFKNLNVGVSPITNEAYIGITNDDNSMWLLKKKIPKSKIINLVINFITDGDKVKENSNGFKRTITDGKNPLYTVYITPANVKLIPLK